MNAPATLPAAHMPDAACAPVVLPETLSGLDVQGLARRLATAQDQRTALAKVSDDHPGMTLQDGYAVQYALRALREAEGRRVVGFKIGLTSRAKMLQMGVSEPSYGFLLDDFAVPPGGSVACASLIHPRVEPEIAFVLARPLRGPGCSVADVLAATAYVAPAIEILDSRYQAFRFDLQSVVADNGSSARYVLGSAQVAVDGLDLRALGMVLTRNGAHIGLAAGAAVLGHPAQSVAMLANLLGRHGERIPAGSVLLSGGATEAIAVQPGDAVQLRVGRLGAVDVQFT